MGQALRSWLWAGIGLLAFLLTAECVCRILPVSTATASGYHISPLILTYPARTQISAADGWDLKNAQQLHTNNLGYVSDRDFIPDSRAVALIGDSYVEASMLDANQRLGAQLQHRLGPDRPVYALGSPGTSLLDYAEAVRYASQQLAVRDFVIFITEGDVQQCLCGSGNTHGPCLDRATLVPTTELRDPPGSLKRLARHSAFAQYIISQLRASPDKLLPTLLALPATVVPGRHEPKAAPQAQAASPLAPEVVDAIIQTFLGRLRPLVSGRLVLVINSPQPGTQPGPGDEQIWRLGTAAAAQGATVVDMRAAYQAHAEASPLSLYVGPYDHHLNGLGLSLVADAAAAAVKSSVAWTLDSGFERPALPSGARSLTPPPSRR